MTAHSHRGGRRTGAGAPPGNQNARKRQPTEYCAHCQRYVSAPHAICPHCNRSTFALPDEQSISRILTLTNWLTYFAAIIAIGAGITVTLLRIVP